MSSEQTRTIEAPSREPEGRLTIESQVFCPCADPWTKAVPSGDVRLSLHEMNDQALSRYDCWWIAWKAAPPPSA